VDDQLQEQVLNSLPEQLRSYGVVLLERLAVIGSVGADAAKFLVAGLPPGSVHALSTTGALEVHEDGTRTLTPRGEAIADMAREHAAQIQETDGGVLRPDEPNEDAQLVSDWLYKNDSDSQEVQDEIQNALAFGRAPVPAASGLGRVRAVFQTTRTNRMK
jgi:hypothetical protein